ncbi:unnamed protein product, partial [marine sediment metagenome]
MLDALELLAIRHGWLCAAFRRIDVRQDQGRQLLLHADIGV